MEWKNHSSKCFMADSSYSFAWRMECGYQRILSLLLIWSGWRERKYSFSIILLSILCILTVVSGVVFVVDHAAPTKLLEPLCEKMIASPSEYQVIDRQQQDITERFCRRYPNRRMKKLCEK